MQRISHEHTVGLPPAPFIRRFAAILGAEIEHAKILDLGCGTGRNGRFLASFGHTVVGLSNDILGLQEAQALNRAARSDTSHLVAADVRNLPFAANFDVMLANEVLHLLPKLVACDTLGSARQLTRRGGLHAISGYLADEQVKKYENRMQCFAPGELLRTYQIAGWEVLEYEEQQKPVSYFQGEELVSSIASVIARKP